MSKNELVNKNQTPQTNEDSSNILSTKLTKQRNALLTSLGALEDIIVDLNQPLFQNHYLKTAPNIVRDEVEIALVIRYLLLTHGEPNFSPTTGNLINYPDSFNLHYVQDRWTLSKNGMLSPLLDDDPDKLYDERRELDNDKVREMFAKVLLMNNKHLLSYGEIKAYGISFTSGWDKILNAYKTLPKVQIGSRVYDPVSLEVTRSRRGELNMGVGFYSYETGTISPHRHIAEIYQHMEIVQPVSTTTSTSNYTSVIPNMALLEQFYRESTLEFMSKKYLSKQFVAEWIYKPEFSKVWEIILSRFGSEMEATYFIGYLSAALTQTVGKNALLVLGQPNTGKSAIVSWLKKTLQENVGIADSDVFVKGQGESFNNKLIPFSKYPLVFIDELPRGKVIDDVTFKTIVNEDPQTMTIKTKYMPDRSHTMIGRPVIFSNHALKVDALGVMERSQLVNQDVVLSSVEMNNFNFEADYLAHSSEFLTLLLVFGRMWYINRHRANYKEERDGKIITLGKVNMLEWFATDTMKNAAKHTLESDQPVIEFFADRLIYDDKLPAYKSIKVTEAYTLYTTYCVTVLGLDKAPTRSRFIDDFCEFILHKSPNVYREEMRTNSSGLVIPGYQSQVIAKK